MAIKCTSYPIKTSTGTAQVKTCVDVSNPKPPYITDRNDNLLYTWDETRKVWQPTGSESEPLNSRGGGFSNTETYGSLLTQNNKTFSDNTIKIINDSLKGSPVAAQTFRNSGVFRPWNQWVASTAPPPAPSPAPSPAPASAPDGNGSNGSTPLPNGDPLYSSETKDGLDSKLTYQYPLDMRDQDYIKFELFRLDKTPNNDFSAAVAALKTSSVQSSIESGYKRVNEKNNKPIILGIQGSIVDQNIANWGSGELNEINKIIAQASGTTMTSKEGVIEAFGKGFEVIADKLFSANGYPNKQTQNLILSALLEQASGSPGLLARLTGGVLNPNMELLFQGPQLRPFNFTFKMSPRSSEEAKVVKGIIRAFKRNMAPIVNNLFLQSPHVFKITYIQGGSDEVHKSLNLIKMCALQNCSVDYTPLGTYMTYDDNSVKKDGTIQYGETPMVSYNMTLSFSEITPIYQQDYDEGGAAARHPIGF